MKVAMISTWNDLCGIASYTKKLVSALNYYCEVNVLSLDAEKRKTGKRYIKELALEANKADIVHIQHEYSFFGGGTIPSSIYRYLPTRIKSIINVSLYFDLLKMINKPIITSVHEIIDEKKYSLSQVGQYGFLLNRLNRLGNRLAFNKPHAVIVHSNNRKEVLLQMGVNNKRINIIPIGIDPPQPTGDVNKFKEKFGISNEYVLTIFGFINWRKGHENAIRMIRELNRDDVKLTIAGAIHPNDTSGYINKLSDLINSLGLEDKVLIIGKIEEEDISTLHAITDITLAAYNDMGGNSSAITTSISYETPVVGWDIVHLHFMNSYLGCIDLLPNDRIDLLAERINQIIDDNNLHNELKNNTITASMKHSRDAEASRTYELYRRVLDQR